MPLRTNGDALRERRLLKGMTIVEFARRAECSAHHVSQVELGKENAGPRFLRTAAALLDCEIDDITDGVIPRRNAKTAETTAKAPRGAA